MVITYVVKCSGSASLALVLVLAFHYSKYLSLKVQVTSLSIVCSLGRCGVLHRATPLAGGGSWDIETMG